MVNSADAALLLLLAAAATAPARRPAGVRKIKAADAHAVRTKQVAGTPFCSSKEKGQRRKKKDVSELYMRDDGRMTVVR